MSGPQLSGKPFDISKQEVWRAYQKVKANKGAPGVDDCSVEAFEKDLKNNLYKIWNRMSSGSYFPPPVRAVEIPKPSGGVRVLGVPTVADRVAQTVVAEKLEKRKVILGVSWVISGRRYDDGPLPWGIMGVEENPP